MQATARAPQSVSGRIRRHSRERTAHIRHEEEAARMRRAAKAGNARDRRASPVCRSKDSHEPLDVTSLKRRPALPPKLVSFSLLRRHARQGSSSEKETFYPLHDYSTHANVTSRAPPAGYSGYCKYCAGPPGHVSELKRLHTNTTTAAAAARDTRFFISNTRSTTRSPAAAAAAS